MLYFAYGSNLDPDQMRRLCPAHQVVGLAALHDHRLFFPLYSQDWSGGVASPESHHGDTLWGVLFELTDADFRSLDEFEGFRAPGDQHNIFERVQVTVELVRPDDGSIPRKVRASIYRAHPSNPSPPSPRYRDTLVKGARHFRLPEEYIARLQALPVGSEAAQ
jgi:hypothetical protein